MQCNGFRLCGTSLDKQNWLEIPVGGGGGVGESRYPG